MTLEVFVILDIPKNNVIGNLFSICSIEKLTNSKKFRKQKLSNISTKFKKNTC